MRSSYVLLLAALLLCGCDILNPFRHACESEMEDVQEEYGAPEDINTYDSSGYQSETWWYWTEGVRFSFAWGSNVTGCEESRATFDSIY